MRLTSGPALALALGVTALGMTTLAGCGPNRGVIQAYCDELSTCGDLPNWNDEDDSVAVCVARHEASIQVLLVNSESECHAYARALEALWACAAEHGCIETGVGNNCGPERLALAQAAEDAGTLCDE